MHSVTRQSRRLPERRLIQTPSTMWDTCILWRLVCSCGWESPERPDPALLGLDKHRHLVKVGLKEPRRSLRPRDGRKSKVYAAERAAFPGIYKTDFKSSAEAQETIDRWISSRWFKARWPQRTKVTVFSRSRGGSTGGFGWRGAQINLAKCHWNVYVLAHELAHILQPSWSAAHGKEFCAIYLALVKQFIGEDEAPALRQAFVAKKIPHRMAIPVRQRRTAA